MQQFVLNKRFLQVTGFTVLLLGASVWTFSGSSVLNHPIRQVIASIQYSSVGPGVALPRRTSLWAIDKDSIYPQPGCEHQDCVESIDNPDFISIAEADTLFSPSEPILILDGAEPKFYPVRLLARHVVVNDSFRAHSGQIVPIAVVYCPLCNSAMALERRVNGQETTFGLSGYAFENTSVIYDRIEKNLWDPFQAVALVGPAVKRQEHLQKFFLTTSDWQLVKERYSLGKVLISGSD